MDPQSSILALHFRADRHRFAIPLSEVEKVFRAAALEPLPGAPGEILGILTAQGRRVPILDFRFRLGLPKVPLDPYRHFIVLNLDGWRLGLLVDAVENVEAVDLSSDENILPPADIAPLPGLRLLGSGAIWIEDPGALLPTAARRTIDTLLASHA